VVGAGFGGLCAIYRMRELGFSVRAIDRASDVGGTWFWNRYPGARCDTESIDYSFSFSEEVQQEWNWTERYAGQPEILRYLQFVADKFELRRHVQFNTVVDSIVFDDASQLWRVSTQSGETIVSRYVIMASGVLSLPKKDAFPGLESFQGEVLHTSSWPAEGVDFSGKRVAVIGTGSTGVQSIPLIAKEAEQLLVFQRTANWSVPAGNRPLRPGEMDELRSTYPERREASRNALAGMPEQTSMGSALDHTDEDRRRFYEAAWADGGGPRFLRTFNDISRNPAANDTAVAFVSEKIALAVHDPAVAALLTPNDHPFGARRLCVDTDYFATYNRPNVRLINVREAPIQEFTPSGLRTADAEYEFDMVVLATGFDALTGPLLAPNIQGRHGQSLREKWAQGPVTFLGLMVHGFPNLFTVVGPGSPSALGNTVNSIEQHIGVIGTALEFARQKGTPVIEASAKAESEWTKRVAELAAPMLLSTTRSWYNGGNIDGKPNVVLLFTGGMGLYRTICNEEIAAGFPGFELSA